MNVAKTIVITAGDQPYEVIVGRGLLGQAGSFLSEKISLCRCVIISDENVAPKFAGELMESLTTSGFESTLITVAPGETSKTLKTAEEIIDTMSRAGLDRSSILIALGGGVIGDLGGFVAATYHRGIRYANIPTTLLAQVDSSIGGKTGVNTALAKNVIGAWHPPLIVISDVETLETLPKNEWKQGSAEMIKHAIIRDAGMFEMLQSFDRSKIEAFVIRNIEIKASIVTVDERETKGERTLLNFGHTVGHGIEAAGQYRHVAHGEAVSLGMVAACEISRRKAGLAENERDRIIELLRAFDLPVRLPENFPRDRVVESIRFDKKFERQQIRFVVTSAIGSARVITDVTLEDIRQAISAIGIAGFHWRASP